MFDQNVRKDCPFATQHGWWTKCRMIIYEMFNALTSIRMVSKIDMEIEANVDNFEYSGHAKLLCLTAYNLWFHILMRNFCSATKLQFWILKENRMKFDSAQHCKIESAIESGRKHWEFISKLNFTSTVRFVFIWKYLVYEIIFFEITLNGNICNILNIPELCRHGN